MKNLLSRIQELPDGKRKIIFWVVMIILALTLFNFYVKYVQKKVTGVGVEKTKEELQVHSLEEILNKVQEIEIPKIEIPEINQEMIQELKKAIEEAPTENNSCEPAE